MDNKSKLNTVLLVIIIILLVIGLVYFLSNNSKQKENIFVNNLPQEIPNNTQNDVTNNKSLELYKNSKVGYEVSYPTNWYIDQNIAIGNELEKNDTINIKNRTDAIKPGGDFEMREDGSMISIEVNGGMNYASYEEFIKDPKWYLGEKTINGRLANIETVIIGGKKFQAFTGIKTPESLPMETYSFIYNGNLYKINYVSGSKEQFDLDYPVFNDFILSFHFQ